jgi:hypothetical protein
MYLVNVMHLAFLTLLLQEAKSTGYFKPFDLFLA